jgi:hypothetical protein
MLSQAEYEELLELVSDYGSDCRARSDVQSKAYETIVMWLARRTDFHDLVP